MPRYNTNGKSETSAHHPSSRVSYYLFCSLCKKLEHCAKSRTCQGAVYLLEQGTLAGGSHDALLIDRRKEKGERERALGLYIIYVIQLQFIPCRQSEHCEVGAAFWSPRVGRAEIAQILKEQKSERHQPVHLMKFIRIYRMFAIFSLLISHADQ